MNKCIGCGVSIQSIDPSKEGYAKNDNARLCERCFRIQNYGDYMPIIKNKEEFELMLKDINDTKDLVLIVCDLFNFNPDMELISKYIHNNVILVLTKRDILPKSLYEEKLLNYIDNVNLNIVDKIVISSMNNYHLDELMDMIGKYKKSNDVYVIGYTNAGKSTLINKLLYNYASSNDAITTSILPNTTLDNIKIKLNDDISLIDTPGVLDNGSIYYLKDIKELKRIIPKKAIKPISYQIKTKQSIVVEDLFRLDVANNDIVMYISNTLKIDRIYKNVSTNLERHDISIKSGEDIVISGIGFIKFMKDEEITLYTINGIKVYTRKSLI